MKIYHCLRPEPIAFQNQAILFLKSKGIYKDQKEVEMDQILEIDQIPPKSYYSKADNNYFTKADEEL